MMVKLNLVLWTARCNWNKPKIKKVWSNAMLRSKYNTTTSIWWWDAMNTGWQLSGQRCDQKETVASTNRRLSLYKAVACLYKSLCTKHWFVQDSLYSNVVQIGPSVPTPWAGWAPPYVAIGTIRAPRYPRYPLVKESSEILKISTRDKDFYIDINMCTA